jgi:hypothetical protein
MSDGIFQLNFAGIGDLPYGIWASTNLSDWTEIGIASQTNQGLPVQPYDQPFQFNDLAATNFPTRFYQLRLP